MLTPGQIAVLGSRIPDSLLRDRFAAAAAGGPALSDGDIVRIVRSHSDLGWRSEILAVACPDPAQRSTIESLIAGWSSETANLPDGPVAAGSERFCNHGPTPPGDGDPTEEWAEVRSDESSAHVGPKRPERIGKYRIVRSLGSGAFGDVWQGYDDDLDRPVAIKVPKHGVLGGPEAAERFLAEARTAAALTHPNLVPVYEVGRTRAGEMFIISRYIDGPTLGDYLARGPVAFPESARFVATVARALHHAHGAGLVHRDVKPANILLDEDTRTPFLADFGLAIPKARSLADTAIAGTPRYMSPEQTCGERIDARSDVFSLGAVLYELLTGAKAFPGRSWEEIGEQVRRARPVPPRDRDPSIPPELERICLRALAKAKFTRYQTAADLADDLDAWLGDSSRQTVAEADVPVAPKGLRSFDGDDARFFLQLLPGARGRDGFPESVRFWKTRLEEIDPEKTFSIGLLYGPSGCGKSSLVKAGIVPRLGAGVRAVVLEASADDTEARLIKALRRAVPGLPADAGLLATVAKVRELAAGKVVLILDQFEQWLQAHPEPSEESLVAALRQCDGAKLQAVVLVRDDFALAADRFMKAVETPIVEGVNYATIDSFPSDHARDVLVRFGQGLGRLPRLATSFSADENAFVDEAIAGLAGNEGRVVPVQLALFADLVKTRPWSPATLTTLGDTGGGRRRLLDRIGVAFLEDSFDSRSANPARRANSAAAKLVLEALLPETGADIKGHKRPVAELRAASDRAEGGRDFDALLRILDGELRLITPTDPPGEDSSEGLGASRREAYYQLTHDYLVPALRDWITAGRRATPQGRAELALVERTAFWSERKEEPQQLPGLLEWARIRWFTRSADWRPAEKKLMAQAGRLHGTRGLSVLTLAALFVAGGLVVRSRVVEGQRTREAEGAMSTLLNADMAAIEGAIAGLVPHATRVIPTLSDVVATGDDAGRRLKAAIGVTRLEGESTGPAGDGAGDYLADRLLSAEPVEVAPIVKALGPRGGQLAERYAAVAADPAAGPQRLRAAAALAAFAPDKDSWKALAPAVVGDLVNVPAVYLATWLEALRGVRGKLVPELVPIFADGKRHELERSLAANILADYAADDPTVLAELAMTAEPSQFAILVARVEAKSSNVVPLLEAEISKRLPEDMPLAAPEREILGIRRAKAATVLARLGNRERMWPLFIHSPDPRVRSYLIHFLGPFGVDPSAIAERLRVEPDVSAKRGLVLTLGEMVGQESSGSGAFGELRGALVPVLRGIFESDPDPGLHSAAEWTLKRCGDGDWITVRVARWCAEAAAGADSSAQLPAIRKQPSVDDSKARRWYVNGQGQTLVVVPGPAEFLMGSTPEEPDRTPDESQHRRRIGRTFAIGAAHVTFGEYDRIVEANHREKQRDEIGFVYARSAELPANGVNWFMAAAYCNALSRAEGLPSSEWVYEESGSVIKLAEGWLSRSGYRLPTEAEWEYATRSGTLTSRFYGQTEALLGDYAWYQGNASLEGKNVPWPVGLKKPNDQGLFDGLGNVFNWCQGEFGLYTEASADDDAEGNLVISRESNRVLRGGSCLNDASLERSACRVEEAPMNTQLNCGFRVARTLRAVSLAPVAERDGGRDEGRNGQAGR